MNIKAYKRLASNIYVRQGHLKEAKFYMEKCKELDNDPANAETNKKDVEAVCNLIESEKKAREELREKHYSSVVEICKSLLENCPNFTEFKYIYIDCLIFTGKSEDASFFLRNKFSDEEKQNEQYEFTNCRVMYYEGKYDKAKSHINLLINRGKHSHSRKYDEFRNLLEKIEIVKDKATAGFMNGNFELAASLYAELIDLDPYHKNFISTMHANIALCKQKMGLLTEAMQNINKSIEFNSNYLKAYFRRGLIYFEKKNFDEALKDFKKVLELDPSYRDAQVKINEIETEKEKEKCKDFYKILELKRDATDYEIRQSYRRLAAKWHPDKNKSNDELYVQASRMFEGITEAYDVLSNKDKKKAYDLGKQYDMVNESTHFQDEEDDILYKKAEEIYYNRRNKGKH